MFNLISDMSQYSIQLEKYDDVFKVISDINAHNGIFLVIAFIITNNFYNA